MAPEGPDGQPLASELIDHGKNSHTFVPKIPMGEPKYIQEFSELDGRHILDVPGMFESKGDEIDVAMDLALQRILLQSKSAKVVLLFSAGGLTQGSKESIQLVKRRLGLMFKDPEKHVLIAITQSRMVEESYSFDEVLDVAGG